MESGQPDWRAHHEEMPQLQHAEEDSLVCGGSPLPLPRPSSIALGRSLLSGIDKKMEKKAFMPVLI